MGTSPNTSLGAVCRICHCGETSIPYMGATGGEPLISPCHCKGTMGLYHRSCVEHWLTLSDTACCEICNFRFELQRKYRSFFDFVKQRGCFAEEGRGTLTDVMCFTVLTPFALGSSYLCFHTFLTCYDSEEEYNVPEGIVMLTMAGFLLMIYVMWLAVTVAFYRSEYRSWRGKNQMITVVDQLSPDESLHFNGRRTPLRTQCMRKMRSFASAATGWMRRGDRPNVSMSYIPEAVMEGGARRETPTGPSSSGATHLFAVSPPDSFYAAGHGVEYPANVYAESSSTPLLGADDEDSSTLMVEMMAASPGSRTSISPIPVCVPRVPEPVTRHPLEHPSPPSLVSSFSPSGIPAVCPLRTEVMARKNVPSLSVTEASGSLLPDPLSTTTTPSAISRISYGFGHAQSPGAAATTATPLQHGHALVKMALDRMRTMTSCRLDISKHDVVVAIRPSTTVRARPLLTSTPSSSRARPTMPRSAPASTTTSDRLETQV